ncbi:hypothetical protein ABOB35_24670, partial [Escherichia coli]
ILLRQKQKKLIMLPSETMIWQPEFTDKTLSRKPGAVQSGDERIKVLAEQTGGAVFSALVEGRYSTSNNVREPL